MAEEKDPTEHEGKEFAPGTILFKEGSGGGDLYFLQKGVVELLVRDHETGENVVITKTSAPAVLGTMTFLEGEPRSATVRCLTNIFAIVVTRPQLEKLLTQVPNWLRIMLKDLSSNLRKQNEEFAHVMQQNETLVKRLQLVKEKKPK